MFTLQKLLELLVLPPGSVVLGLVVALMLLRRSRVWSWRVLVVSVVVLYLASIEPTAVGLTRGLQRGYEPLRAQSDAEAIVVLAGGASSVEGVDELGGESWRRLWHGVEQYRLHEGRVPLVYAGGSGDPFVAQSREAALARSYALAMGIVPEDVLVESQSRTTYETSQALPFVLGDVRDIVLVTSAVHMRRAQATFEAAGYRVIPAPADFRLADVSFDPLSMIPTHASLSASNAALHEWLGIGWYAMARRL